MCEDKPTTRCKGSKTIVQALFWPIVWIEPATSRWLHSEALPNQTPDPLHHIYYQTSQSEFLGLINLMSLSIYQILLAKINYDFLPLLILHFFLSSFISKIFINKLQIFLLSPAIYIPASNYSIHFVNLFHIGLLFTDSAKQKDLNLLAITIAFIIFRIERLYFVSNHPFTYNSLFINLKHFLLYQCLSNFFFSFPFNWIGSLQI